jgi:hypothetical protein
MSIGEYHVEEKFAIWQHPFELMKSPAEAWAACMETRNG